MLTLVKVDGGDPRMHWFGRRRNAHFECYGVEMPLDLAFRGRSVASFVKKAFAVCCSVDRIQMPCCAMRNALQ
jgi:hypothetical protein